MNFYDTGIDFAVNHFNSNAEKGLSEKILIANRSKYGRNILTEKKKRGFFKKLIDALKEPMLIILMFSFVIALGTNLGKYFKSGEADFAECFGILFAVILSVGITLIMEGSSEKAFSALNKIYDNVKVRLIRNGHLIVANQSELVSGDIVILETGDKIVADGRLIESNSLSVDESALTGESLSSNKTAGVILSSSVPLAERNNMVYSGTFVTNGSGKMIVTAVGDNTEIGNIAGELTEKEDVLSPLQQKLNKLGKTISITGAITAIAVFIISIIKLSLSGTLSFDGVQDLFVSCIILIVAAVPEGLPTIVAVSLALNMIKLAKENALIKKMTATETTGAVSVICSDKTGTLTMNKMTVISVCSSEFCADIKSDLKEILKQNFVINSTADLVVRGRRVEDRGSATECALLRAYQKGKNNVPYDVYRKRFEVVSRVPFSSQDKYMTTTVKIGGGLREFIKGAPEVILKRCNLTEKQVEKILKEMTVHQKKACRILCFAHLDYTAAPEQKIYLYDGYVSIADPVRKEVQKAISDCRRAGIKVKMLTGDNVTTAFAIADQLKIATDFSQVITAAEVEKMDEETLKKVLPKITVIARSTPSVKLKVVRALKSMGEVVAVTGDGINDAPAIKHADVGIAMGISGSEISKEAADAVLLDDSFATVVKAVSFGRNVYRNLQRFILFQLTVNLSALLFITVCAIMGLPAPFNTFELLWINVIMDGPPALTLGLEKASDKLMGQKPVKRTDGIVNLKMFIRILIGGIFIGVIMILQYLYNFLGVKDTEKKSVVFTLFILFQLFNAFNCRELGAESVLKSFGKNKIMVATFLAVFLLQAFIVQIVPGIFGVSSMSFMSWIKTLALSSAIVVASELYKLIYRIAKSSGIGFKFNGKTGKNPILSVAKDK